MRLSDAPEQIEIAVRSGPDIAVWIAAALVALARRAGVDTPEDPYPRWPSGEVVALLFTSFDYSFRPPEIRRDAVLRWAAEARCVSADERLIRPAPFARMDEWCAQLCDAAEARLTREVPPETGTVLVSHYPLRSDLVRIPRIPRFTPWCGTVRTADWHRRFRAVVAVSGHLHTRRTDWRDGTRFEEVSLGYARRREDLALGDERGGVLATGDLAQRDADGAYSIVGRKSRFVKLFGNRVNLEEVEHFLRGAGIDCACAGDDALLRIYITNPALGNDAVAAAQRLTQLHPSAFRACVIDSIPRNEAGKIIYAELP